MAVEDAAVLSELLITHASVDDDLWAAFTERRHARAKWVIDTSTEICQWLLDELPCHGSGEWAVRE